MPSRLQRVLALGVTISAALVPAASALAEEIETTSDRVIFGKDAALWSMPAQGGEPELLLQLPWQASELTKLRAAANGTALLIQAAGFTAWTALDPASKSGAAVRLLPCSGPVDLASDGDRVACNTQDGRNIAVYRMRPTLEVRILPGPAKEALFFGGDQSRVLTLAKKSIVEVATSETVSPHRPDHSLVVSPDGKRALGSYTEQGIDIVYGFQLNGKAVKRTLMHAARSVATSADSSWAAIQQDDDACAVRIVGGQYMCWRRTKALDISSLGHSLLVSRPSANATFELLLGAVRGTSSVKPTLLVGEVAGVAAFWPAQDQI